MSDLAGTPLTANTSSVTVMRLGYVGSAPLEAGWEVSMDVIFI
jgi:hypothetical protein